MGYGITAPADQKSQAVGSGSAALRDHGSGCTIFVGSGAKPCFAFGIKDQKFGYKNGISNEKKYLATSVQERIK